MAQFILIPVTEEMITDLKECEEMADNGEWIPNKKLTLSPLLTNYSCSICGTEGHRTNFCPNCGADMRKKVQHG